MNGEEARTQLVELLTQTADDHHAAFKETDGVDPDWPIWYAGRLLEQGFDRLLDAAITKSDLIYLLVAAAREQEREAPGGNWARYYTDFFVRRYLL